MRRATTWIFMLMITLAVVCYSPVGHRCVDCHQYCFFEPFVVFVFGGSDTRFAHAGCAGFGTD